MQPVTAFGVAPLAPPPPASAAGNGAGAVTRPRAAIDPLTGSMSFTRSAAFGLLLAIAVAYYLDVRIARG